MSVAGTSITVHPRADVGPVDHAGVDEQHTVRFETAPAPASACSWCMRTADQVEATVGGASTDPSATTTVDSVAPPRIMPP